MNNNIFFLDIEFGQIYGFCSRGMIPVEIGGIISTIKTDSLSIVRFVHHEFPYNGEVVLRKNLIDDLGNTIGLHETVVNTKIPEYQINFDPSYSLNASDKKNIRNKAYRATFNKLRYYFDYLLNKYEIEQLAFFGSSEDLKILRRAGINISNLKVIDIQNMIYQKLQHKVSLDKISKVIEFYSNENSIGSTHFCYDIPPEYKHAIKPHRAIGDGCRMFLVYQEFVKDSQAFIEKSTHHFQKIKKEREKKAEKMEQTYNVLKENFSDISTGLEKAYFIVKPVSQPYIQNGQQEPRHFQFILKKHNFTIDKAILSNPLLKEREIYPIKYCSIHGFYCSQIEDIKAIATLCHVEVYTNYKQYTEQAEQALGGRKLT